MDSVLQSSSSEDGPKTFGGGGSVVVTSEAKEMQSQEPVTTSIPEISNSPMPSAGVVSSQPEPERRGHFSATMSRSSATQPTKAAQPTQASKPVKAKGCKKESRSNKLSPNLSRNNRLKIRELQLLMTKSLVTSHSKPKEHLWHHEQEVVQYAIPKQQG